MLSLMWMDSEKSDHETGSFRTGVSGASLPGCLSPKLNPKASNALNSGSCGLRYLHKGIVIVYSILVPCNVV